MTQFAEASPGLCMGPRACPSLRSGLDPTDEGSPARVRYSPYRLTWILDSENLRANEEEPCEEE